MFQKTFWNICLTKTGQLRCYYHYDGAGTAATQEYQMHLLAIQVLINRVIKIIGNKT